MPRVYWRHASCRRYVEPTALSDCCRHTRCVSEKSKCNRVFLSRIKGLIVAGKLSLSSIKLVVLDEADKLMEDVFRSQIKYIFRNLPDKKQVLAFSATYDDALLTTLDQYVPDPYFVMLSSGTPALEGVCQYYKTVEARGENSTQSLTKYEIYECKFHEVAELFGKVPFYQSIVFLNHRGRAIDLTKWLTKQGWQAAHIAASLSQRERLEAISSARDFRVRVLVCSDLIARGIDIDRVNLVVNLDLPRDPETYLHRVGRTGRFGTTGLAVSFVDDEEMRSIRVLQDEYGVKIRELPENISPNIFTQPLSATDQEAFVGHEMQRQNVVDHPEKNPEPPQPRNDHARPVPRMRPPHRKPRTHAPIDTEPPGSVYQDTSAHNVNADYTTMYSEPTAYYAGWQWFPYSRAWPYYYHQVTPVRNWTGGAGPGVEWDFIPPDLPF
ncbi:P-loop containing nucleoside triphosphate hydrolase protein [Endogone sp. FLAS-F59071]|nr:P-loop containing nucleoside triphosphate hydrolase protein [Endogone sp. FLAS-F59071]|eukprot:RUS20181.1 P-loop containing nucleoside triphosphate hydrolase protein [Endogone sp. FLAS-F59071]